MAAMLEKPDRRRLLLGAAGLLAPGFSASPLIAPVLAQAPPKSAEIIFAIDGDRLRVLLGHRLRDGLKRVFADRPDFFAGGITTDLAGVRVKLRRAEDVAALAVALPRLDPGLRPAAEPAQGLYITALAGGEARIDWSAPAFFAQASLWRDRAKKMLETALAPRKTAFTDTDAQKFVLALEGMDRARWLAWIGGRIDLFFPAVFSLAPVAPAPGPATFTPRPAPNGGPEQRVTVDGEKILGNEDDVFLARVEGTGPGARLVLELTRPGADMFSARKLPVADKTAYALMFDKALAAQAVLDGAAADGRMRLKVEHGLGAAYLAERIFLGGSAPMVRQVEARFG